MSKYEVTHDGGDLRYGVQRDDEHVVGGPFVSYTESEAEIIAFALNAIADGDQLHSVRFYPNGTRGGKEVYGGRTDGIAPAEVRQ